MKVKDVMNDKPITATPSTSIYDVWKILYKKNIHSVPIVDRKNNLVGTVSEDDILQRLYPKYHEFIIDISSHNFSTMEVRARELRTLSASDVMKKRIRYARVDEPMMKALSKLIVYEKMQLPVVDDSMKVVGMVSRGDIFAVLFTKYLKNAE